MTTPEPNARAEAVEQFVARLVQLRADAGNPSFRTMAKRSGAISHATMHDAVQGVRFPSWETTVEFARACDADPDDLRTEWERADAIVHPPEDEPVPAEPEPPAEPADAAPAAAVGGGTDGQAERGAGGAGEGSSATGDGGPKRREPPKLLIGIGIGVLIVLLAGAGIWQLVDEPADAAGDETPSPSANSASNTVSYPPMPSGLVPLVRGPGGCLKNGEGGTDRPSLHEGDEGKFIEDVGLDDCGVAKRGADIDRGFRLKNAGTVPWVGRKLVWVDKGKTDAACHIPNEVPIPAIKPGETKVVTIPLTAPEKKTTCFARWMQLDKSGQWAFPGQRPYYLSFRVE